LPIVALTAGALVGERQRALDAGMNDFISKPFDPQALIRKVRRLTEESRGEQLPMVLLDTKQIHQTADGPFIASIDAGVVQQMFGQDLTLFKSLLTRMLQNFADFALPIHVSPNDEPLRSQLQGRLHKFKGSAGMLGATRLMRLAGAAEGALHDSRPVEMIGGILGQLALAFNTLAEEAEPFLRKRSEPTPIAAPGAEDAPPMNSAAVEELCVLLDHQNLAAVDQFALLSPSLPGVIGAARFNRLREAVDNLDFQVGADLLRQALQTRHGHLDIGPSLPAKVSTG
jgi:CheY-like chemotaxis protein